MQFKNNTALVLLLIVVSLGLFLRLYNLDEKSVWSDEAYSINAGKQENLNGILKAVEETEINTPLYYIMLKYWSSLFGYSVYAMRLLSALIGTLSIVFLYLAASELFGRKVGLLSALFIAISPVNILYSQEIRAYAMLTTFTIISYFFFIRTLKGKGSFFLLSLSNALAFAVHYFGIITLVLQHIIAYFFWMKYDFDMKKWLYAQIPVLGVILLYSGTLIGHIFKLHAGLKLQLAGILGLSPMLANLGIILFFIPIAALVLIVFLICSRHKQILRNYNENNLSYPVLIFTVLFTLLYLVQVRRFIEPSYLTRFPLFVLPIGYCLFSKAIMDVKRFRKIIIALLIVLSATILFQYYTTDTKADWKDASSFLLENSIRGDVFLFDKVVAPFKFHYGEGNEIVYRLPAIDKGGLEGFEAIKKKDLDNSTGIWLVLSKNYQNKDRYRELLRSEYEEDLDAEFYRIKIYHYSQKQ